MPSRPPVHRHHSWKPTETRREQLQALDRWRGSAASRGYDRTWRALRLQILEAEPLCRFCWAHGLVEPATEVDHIKPLATHPELRLDPTNLRALCKPCHSRLTAGGAQRTNAAR